MEPKVKEGQHLSEDELQLLCEYATLSGNQQPVRIEITEAAMELGAEVARCTKIINPNTEDVKYVINIKQIAKVICPRNGHEPVPLPRRLNLIFRRFRALRR